MRDRTLDAGLVSLGSGGRTGAGGEGERGGAAVAAASKRSSCMAASPVAGDYVSIQHVPIRGAADDRHQERRR